MEKYRNGALISFILGIIGILGVFLLSYIAFGLGLYTLIQLMEDPEKKGMHSRSFAMIGLLLGIAGVLVNMHQHGLLS